MEKADVQNPHPFSNGIQHICLTFVGGLAGEAGESNCSF